MSSSPVNRIPSTPLKVIRFEGGPTPGRILSLNLSGVQQGRDAGYEFSHIGNDKGIVEEVWTVKN